MKILFKSNTRIKEVNEFYYLMFGFLMDMGNVPMKEMVITSGNDGIHKRTSQHYKNKALDIRGRHLSYEEAIVLMDRFEKKFPVVDGNYLCQFEYWDRGLKEMIKINVSKNDWKLIVLAYYSDPKDKVCHFHIEER